MLHLVSILVTMILLGGAVAVIAAVVRDYADAIVAALAGRPMWADAPALPVRVVRVNVRPAPRRPMPLQPLRAAA